MKAHVWDERKCLLGEGPVSFGEKNSNVAWVDITGRKVLHKNLTTGVSGEFSTTEDIGFVIPRAHGGFILGTLNGPSAQSSDGQITSMVERAHWPIPTRWNDAKVSPDGDLWLGSMSYEMVPGASALFRLDRNRKKIDTMLTGTTISNGMGWSPDSSTYYFIDTPTRSVDAFDYAHREISNRRSIWKSTHESDGFPDGACVDSGGALWVAFWNGGCVRRIDPHYGVIEIIELPVKNVTSCAFAGENLSTLIITTAESKESPHELDGMTFAVETEIEGLKTQLFPS